MNAACGEEAVTNHPKSIDEKAPGPDVPVSQFLHELSLPSLEHALCVFRDWRRELVASQQRIRELEEATNFVDAACKKCRGKGEGCSDCGGTGRQPLPGALKALELAAEKSFAEFKEKDARIRELEQKLAGITESELVKAAQHWQSEAELRSKRIRELKAELEETREDRDGWRELLGNFRELVAGLVGHPHFDNGSMRGIIEARIALLEKALEAADAVCQDAWRTTTGKDWLEVPRNRIDVLRAAIDAAKDSGAPAQETGEGQLSLARAVEPSVGASSSTPDPSLERRVKELENANGILGWRIARLEQSARGEKQ